MVSDPSEDPTVSKSQAHEAVEHVARLTDSGLPLASGLQALSAETDSPHLRRVLQSICNRLDEGEPLQAVLGEHASAIPPHLTGLIEVGVRTGSLGLILEKYVEYARRSTEIRRRIWLSLGYSIILILAALILVATMLVFTVPDLAAVYDDFSVELPASTVTVIMLGRVLANHGPAILVGIVVLAAAVWMSLSWIFGRAVRRRLLNIVPLIGPLLHFSSLAHFCRLLGILVDNRIELPAALRMAAEGTGDPNIQDGGHRLAEQVESGVNVSRAAATLPQFPPTLINFLRWDEHPDALSDALETAAEILEARASVQTRLLAVFIEPVVILFVAMSVGMLVISLLLPSVKLLNALS